MLGKGTKEDRRWIYRWLGVCCSLFLSPLSPLLSPLELRQRAGIGRDPVTDTRAVVSGDITKRGREGEMERERERELSRYLDTSTVKHASVKPERRHVTPPRALKKQYTSGYSCSSMSEFIRGNESCGVVEIQLFHSVSSHLAPTITTHSSSSCTQNPASG